MSAAAIRDTVRAGKHADATRQFGDWMRSLPLEHASLRHAAELIEWARLFTECEAAHLRARIDALRAEAHAARAYGYGGMEPK